MYHSFWVPSIVESTINYGFCCRHQEVRGEEAYNADDANADQAEAGKTSICEIDEVFLLGCLKLEKDVK
jgi:hypothetical protein